MTGGGRRELAVALVVAAAAGGLALAASGQTWARVTADRRPPLPPVTGALSGGTAAPLVPATGLVLLAAALALVAVGGVARTVVGLLLTAAGAALTWSGVRVLAGGLDAAGADLPGISGGSVRVDVVAAWPVLALIAGVAGLLAGLFVVVRGRSWPGLGRRYERGPAAAPRSDADRAQAAWTALDRGEDPTA
jgi:uncharacterized membrane protein (TIGR02234 family)